MKPNSVIFFLLLFLSCFISKSQTTSSVIMVTDKETGVPLEGATIVSSKGESTSSDSTGRALLKDRDHVHWVSIRKLGYQTDSLFFEHDIPNILEVQLYAIAHAIEEVFVYTGYQKIAKEQLTGSVYTVNNELLNTSVSTSIIDRLENNVPGLAFNKTAQNPSHQTQISIRGQSTLFSRPDPLIVIDNFPYDGDLAHINPDEIESISILKDAGAASVWGARAANGVIVLTTKRSSVSEGSSLSFNSYATLSGVPNLWYEPKINTSDYIDIERSVFDLGVYAALENNLNKPMLSPVVELLIANRDGNLNNDELDTELNKLRNRDVRNDLSKHYYQTQRNYHHSFGYNRKEDKHQFSMRIGYDKNRDHLVANGFERLTAGADIIQKVFKDKMSIRGNVQYNWTDNYQPNTGQIIVSELPLQEIYPYAQLKEKDGTASVLNKDYRRPYLESLRDIELLDWYYRPLDELDLADHHRINRETRINMGADYHVGKRVTVEGTYQFQRTDFLDRNNQKVETYAVRNLINRFTQIGEEGELIRPIPYGGILNRRQVETMGHRGRLQIMYNEVLPMGLEIHALGGVELSTSVSKGHTSRLYGYNEERAGITLVDYVEQYPIFVNQGLRSRIPFQDNISHLTDRFVSYYQNTSFTFKGRYVLTGSTRLDQSNIFGVDANQKGVPLWSLGGAWTVSEEPFFKRERGSYLKFRLTYGSNGNVNRNLSAYTTASYYSTSPFTLIPYASIVNPPNALLRWERTKVWNAGVDFSFLNNRLSGGFDWYQKKGVDLIGDTEYPASSGISRFRGNVASTVGRGFEMLLRTENLRTALGWQTTFMMSKANDEVSKYMDLTIPALNMMNSSHMNPVKGKPLYGLYSFYSAGLDGETGDPIGYLEGKESTDWNAIVQRTTLDELIFHGSSRPIWLGSLRNSFSYKAWSLSTNISYKGGYFYRLNSIRYVNGGLLDYGLESSHADHNLRWQKPGDELHTSVPSLPSTAVANRDNLYLYGNPLVRRADHIRWQDISFSYKFPSHFIRGIHTALEIYGYINNLGIIWKKENTEVDPDYALRGQIPPVKTYSLGLRLTL